MRLLACLLLTCAVVAARAELLDTLPRDPVEPLTAELRTRIAEARAEPKSVERAVTLAAALYRHATVEGELRFVGYARAALDPWWREPSPPPEVLVVRANLRQYVHDFDAALADLDQVLSRQPEHAQALAIRAAIRMVRAEYRAARADCVRLKPLTSELIGLACEASVDGLLGKAQASYDALSRMLARAGRVPASERLWVTLRLAEMAERLGRSDTAERHYRQALFISPRDQYTLVNYADLLLDLGRPAEVVSLLAGRTGAEHLLLRLVLAEKTLHAPEYAVHALQVEGQFAAARQAGHAVHEQEESRFALHVQGRPRRALELALANWKLQREPRDARAVLEAAAASRDAGAARPVLDWLATNGIEDERLRLLAEGLSDAAISGRVTTR